jgi:hypothetical protein
MMDCNSTRASRALAEGDRSVQERDLVGTAPGLVRIAGGAVICALQPLDDAVSHVGTNARGSVTLDIIALSVDVDGGVVGPTRGHRLHWAGGGTSASSIWKGTGAWARRGRPLGWQMRVEAWQRWELGPPFCGQASFSPSSATRRPSSASSSPASSLSQQNRSEKC